MSLIPPNRLNHFPSSANLQGMSHIPKDLVGKSEIRKIRFDDAHIPISVPNTNPRMIRPNLRKGTRHEI